ncbi:MAG: DUF4430 domain-containing protein [Clostridiales bacterium]|nr:DUF4430 domain-containing protein [Clostridiales bacterium]
METQKKKRIMNIAMAALIAVIVLCGVMAVGNIKGWFDGTGSYAQATEVKGIANIEREGVAYRLEDETALKASDIVETKSDATARIEAGDNDYIMAGDTEGQHGNLKGDMYSISLSKGEIFVVINDGESFKDITVGDYSLTARGTVFSVNSQTGSMGVNVYEGEVALAKGDTEKTAKAGQGISVAGDEVAVNKLKAEALNDFNIEQAKLAGGNRELCFTAEQLDKVVSDREKEVKKAVKEQKKHEQEVIAAGESGLEGSKSSGSASSGGVKTCTIQIRCDTILNNMGKLTAGKEAYVPSNGIILATSTVQFRDGETAFDVLKRACNAAGIQLEYSYTPMYGSYYIEGMNHLYEFDCGEQSGWMYKVNGWFPNYGVSSYKMKNGDTMVWCYTCNGLGADVGGGM